MKRAAAIFFFAMFGMGASGRATGVSFRPRELFRIPFGTSRETLAARIDGGRLLFPREFTMDTAGHFYIYDINNHRIARFSSAGQYQMGLRYDDTAQQAFAHADSRNNLWLLVSDPTQGTYYGVYDVDGHRVRAGMFRQYASFRLHLDDAYGLHVILTSKAEPPVSQSFFLDEQTLLMKKENVGPPPENHHELRRSDHLYSMDPLPNGATDDAARITRVTDESHREVARLRGTVIYVTESGDVYSRVGKREINIYGVDGVLEGKLRLSGLSSACEAIRFDAHGNVYELDGIPDQTDAQLHSRVPPVDPRADFEDLHYTGAMPGLRLIEWQR